MEAMKGLISFLVLTTLAVNRVTISLSLVCYTREPLTLEGCLAFLGGSVVRICLPMQETQEVQVQSLGREGPLGVEMATCSNILAWKIPWTEEPGGLQSMGSQGVRHD